MVAVHVDEGVVGEEIELGWSGRHYSFREKAIGQGRRVLQLEMHGRILSIKLLFNRDSKSGKTIYYFLIGN